MTRYANGRAPLSELVQVGDQQYLPAGTAARWRELQRLAWEKYGVWLVISPGWNAYRPYDVQVQYRQELGIWAAVPGTSSHGLTYQGRDCAAIDVYNWGALGWARFVALCRIVGFTVDFVTPQELWHIGDFDPFTIPAFASITINPATTAPNPEDDMFTDEDRALLRDVQKRIKGDNPDADMLQEIRERVTQVRDRVRGDAPNVDMLQDTLGQVEALRVDLKAAIADLRGTTPPTA